VRLLGFSCSSRRTPGRWALLRKIASRHPGFREAVLADARVTLRYRGEREVLRSGLDAAIQILRLTWSDAFLAQILYQLKARLQPASRCCR
jgi:hypothetical protein